MNTSVSLAPNHPDLTVTNLRGIAKERTVYWVNALSTNARYGVHNSNITSCVRALKERILYVKVNGKFILTPGPTASFKAVCHSFYDAFKNHVQHVSPLTQDQFLGAYKGRRRTVYENAYKSLQGKPFKLSDSYVNFFVKCEKINFSAKPDAVPRGISPRSPRYHVKLGPYVKRIEKKTYDIIAKVFGAVTVFKGLNAVQRAKHLRSHWESFVDPVAIGLDASRFDQHVSIQALKFEHSFYKLFYPNVKEFAYYLSLQCNNKLFANCPDGRAKCNVKGKRMSGDMNTALGNCLLMCCMVWTYLSTRVSKFRLANDGDDCVVIIERSELTRIKDLSSFFLTLGFDMKIEDPVYTFEEIEFCQSQPVWTPDGWLMVRKVSASISKDSISIKPLDSPKVFRRWMKAVGEGGLSLTGGIPIVQDIYKRYDEIGGNVKPLDDPTMETGLRMLGQGMKRRYQSVDPMTRVSFWRAFGIPSSKQLCYEEVVGRACVQYPVDPQIIPHPQLRMY